MIVIALPTWERLRLPLVSSGLVLVLGLALISISASRDAARPIVQMTDSTPVEPATPVQAVAAPLLETDREMILDVIRDHRRTTSESWRKQLADAIYQEAVAAEIDPLMVASIVAKESSFKSRVVSRAGAVGLMQLRPWVARDVAERREIEWNGLETLHSPGLNVRLGITYYQELIERFEGDEVKALTAYNYGPSRVSRQLRRGTYSGSDYADRVLCFYQELRTKREGSDDESST